MIRCLIAKEYYAAFIVSVQHEIVPAKKREREEHLNCSCQVDIRKKQKRFPHVWLVLVNGISHFAALAQPVILSAQASFCTVPAVDSQDYADGDACCNSQ